METRKKSNITCLVAILFSLGLILSIYPVALAEEEGSAQKVCPVMGGKIDKSVYVDHEGNRVYFCCTACIDKFKKDPAKYLKKMNDEGVALENLPQVKGQCTEEQKAQCAKRQKDQGKPQCSKDCTKRCCVDKHK